MKPMKYRYSIIYLLIIVFLAMASIADAFADEQETDGKNVGYTAVLYDNSNGLPTSEANAIAQTGNGCIWIGSYSGLIRYDGNSFFRYDSSSGVTSVVSLYVDSRDRLWIGTNDSGVALYEGDGFRIFGKAEGLNSVSVRSITEDSAGNIIIATTAGLSYIDADYALHRLDDARLNEEYVCEIKRDADGTVYGDTLSGAFFAVENLNVTHFYRGQELGMGVISSICPAPDVKGQIYLGTEESKVIRKNLLEDTKDYEVLSVAPLVNINAIEPIGEGRLALCADNGIGYFDQDGTYNDMPNIPMNNSVDEMMVDYEGNLWFVSSRQGVMKICSSRFTNLNKLAGLGTMVVNTTCIYQEELYIGTDEGLYVLTQDYEQKENVLTELLRDIRIRCIKEDSAGNLWLCSYSDLGLICYHGDGTYEVFNMDNGLKSNRVRSMTELSDGTIAVAVSGGVNLIREGRITAVYDEDNGICNTEILSICEGENGDIYIGSDGDGLYILNGDRVTNIGLDDGLKSEVILRIKKDPEKALYWIITSNSISYMENGEIKTLTKFPYSNNFDMYFDHAGNVWILSSNGIYVANKEQLLADEELDYSFYDMKCGLACIATANSRSYLAEDGTLYISGASGVSTVNIYEQMEQNEEIRLAVPYIEADDQIINLTDGGEITVPANCKRLTIYGYAFTYALQNPRLSYYLEGFDENAVAVSKQDMQPISYTNLDGGRYVFHLSVINTLTGEVENTVSVTIIKEKAFYEHAWFWLCITLAVIAAAFAAVLLYTRYKTAGLVKKQEENRIFISQIIQAFAKSIDLKDKYTNGHSFRVALYAGMIAEKMGYSEAQVKDIYNIGLLHDIGKITIPDEILNKPGKLTEEEYSIIKQHAINGYDILKEIEIFPELALGAGYHHERIDGKGYPSGKSGDEIPMIAQIIAVADTFDAMNSTRPYRRRMKMEEIVAELERVAGTQLNADIVQVLLGLISEGRV